ncbi:hypothetical protein ACJW30_12G019800 [Castanea mollissima]
MASKKFITWGLHFVLMFLLASEAASRKVLVTSELGNSTPTAAIIYGVGYGNKQPRESSTLEGEKSKGPVPPAGPNPGAHIPKKPPGSRT